MTLTLKVIKNAMVNEIHNALKGTAAASAEVITRLSL